MKPLPMRTQVIELFVKKSLEDVASGNLSNDLYRVRAACLKLVNSAGSIVSGFADLDEGASLEKVDDSAALSRYIARHIKGFFVTLFPPRMTNSAAKSFEENTDVIKHLVSGNWFDVLRTGITADADNESLLIEEAASYGGNDPAPSGIADARPR